MSYRPSGKKVQSVSAVARLDDWRTAAQEAAGAKPAKVVARIIKQSPRHVHNIKSGLCEISASALIALAQQDSKLRSVLARALCLEQHDPRVEAILALVREYGATPEAGDQAQPGEE